MGMKDVGGRVGCFISGGVMGLTGEDLLIKENVVGIRLGLFLVRGVVGPGRCRQSSWQLCW